MINQLKSLRSRFSALEQREQILIMITAIIIILTLFYLVIWEPIFKGLEQQQALYKSQQNTLVWMQNAASEVKQLKRSGTQPITSTNQPISLVIEQSASSSGLKSSMDKLESSGKDDVRVKLNAASFNQILIWLNTLEQRHAINVTSSTIERAEKAGRVNARFSFKRN